MTLRPSQIINHIDTDTDSILSDDQSYVAYSDDEIDIIKNKHEHIIPIKHRTNIIKKKFSNSLIHLTLLNLLAKYILLIHLSILALINFVFLLIL